MPVTIGDYVMFSPNTLISTVNHLISQRGRRAHLDISKSVAIGSDIWIGGNVTILPGVTIGNNVIIAAGAVVTKDIPDNCLAGSVSARKIRAIEMLSKSKIPRRVKQPCGAFPSSQFPNNSLCVPVLANVNTSTSFSIR